jgi:hypothetical protein
MVDLLESVTNCQQSSVKTRSNLRIAMQRQPFIDETLNLERGFRQSPALHGLPKRRSNKPNRTVPTQAIADQALICCCTKGQDCGVRAVQGWPALLGSESHQQNQEHPSAAATASIHQQNGFKLADMATALNTQHARHQLSRVFVE